jgi:hypothetical protein
MKLNDEITEDTKNEILLKISLMIKEKVCQFYHCDDDFITIKYNFLNNQVNFDVVSSAIGSLDRFIWYIETNDWKLERNFYSMFKSRCIDPIKQFINNCSCVEELNIKLNLMF